MNHNNNKNNNKDLNEIKGEKTFNILSWNIRGCNQTQKNNLKILQEETNSAITCLQETFFSNRKETFKDLKSFHRIKNTNKCGRINGGVSTLVKYYIECK